MIHRRSPVQRRSRRRGLTLVELLMALSILALIAASTGGMLTALAHGTDTDSDVRQLVARQRMIALRLNAAVRGSRVVLAAGDDWMVLWGRDLNGNDKPDLLELRRLERDAATDTLVSLAAADGVADVAYALSDDFEAVTDALRGPGFPATTWGVDVADLMFTLDEIEPHAAAMLAYRVTLTQRPTSDVLIGAARLRNTARTDQ